MVPSERSFGVELTMLPKKSLRNEMDLQAHIKTKAGILLFKKKIEARGITPAYLYKL